MAKISDITEAKIKAAMKIEDVLADQGVVLSPRGAQLVGLCPFHEDRSIGSFQVSKAKNVCSCYACGATGLNPIDTLIRLKYSHLSEKEAYPQALRYLAAMYNILVDDEPVPQVEKKAPILPPPPKRQPIMWHADLVKPFKQYNDRSPLLGYLRALPMADEYKARLEKAIANYQVGTYPSGWHEGWSIWWLIDELGYVRSGKMMKYRPDGHRDKAVNSTWVHTQLAKAGKYNQETHEPNLRCLFGMHMADMLPKAKICVVESEKTAVICSAFFDNHKALWMATGGKSNLSSAVFDHLIRTGRRIELYPDIDAYDDWCQKVERDARLAGYGKLSISALPKELWTEQDGEKADIADMLLRIFTTPDMTEAEKVYQEAKIQLGLTEDHEPLRQLIGALELKIEN